MVRLVPESVSCITFSGTKDKKIFRKIHSFIWLEFIGEISNHHREVLFGYYL